MSVKHNKELYRKLCEQEPSIPLFLTAAWLDHTAGSENWDVALVVKGEEVFAAWPYTWLNKWGFRIAIAPPLTPYLGIWIKYPAGQKTSSKLSHEKEMVGELVTQLPSFSHFYQHFSVQFTNGLPLHWKGFRHTLRYTYVLDELQDLDEVKSRFRQNIRRALKKAEELVLEESNETDLIFKLSDRAYGHQKINFNLSLKRFKSLYNYIEQNNIGQLYQVTDKEGAVHAMMLFVWDKESVYYLFGAANPDYKTSGAMSLLIWQGIQIAAQKGLVFNFEGSMIESIERFFSSFGAKQQPYLQVSKTNSLLYKWINLLRGRNL
jgi:hypothetical protein